MGRTWANNFKRAFLSPPFLVGIIGMGVAVFFGAFEYLLPMFNGYMQGGLMPGYTEQTLLSSLRSEMVMMVLPIIATLPYTTAFVGEYKSKYIRLMLTRTGKNAYTSGHVMATGVSGGAVLSVALLIISAIFMILLKPQEQTIESLGQVADTGFVQETTLQAQLVFAELMTMMLIIFLVGYFWAEVGALFSSLTQNTYIAYAAPFILYYVLVILAERYFVDVYILNPKEWVRAEHNWPGGTLGIALFLGELCAIVSIIYGVTVKGMLKKL